MKQPSQRQLRINEEIRHVVSETLHRGHFHSSILIENAPHVTVSAVNTSPDLRNATIYVMSLGGQNMDKIIPALNDMAYYFQSEVNKKLTIKLTPRLSFKEDESFAEAAKIERLLQTIK